MSTQTQDRRSRRRITALAVLALSALATFATGCLPDTSSTLASCPPVREGDSGDCVLAVQNTLSARGAAVGVDGAFGPATRAAVENFQRDNGLPVDGVVGPETSAALERTLCERFFGSCVYYLDRQGTAQIHSVLGAQAGPGEQVALAVACRVLKDPLAVTACNLLGPVGSDVLRREAAAAAADDACLAIRIADVPVRVYRYDGEHCENQRRQ